MTILITGGHLTPALGYIDYVRQAETTASFLFVGREFSQSGQKSHEQTEIEKRQLPFIPFTAPRLTAFKPVKVLAYPFQFVSSVVVGLGILLTRRPTVVLSFGGYLASPIAVASWLLGIPLVTHEQTLVAGQANRWIAQLADRVAVSDPASLAYFPPAKTVVTGNPLRAALLNDDQKLPTPSWFKNQLTKPLLYVTGGNQGSLIINQTIKQLLPQLTKDFVVIHACGNPSDQGNSYRELQRAAGQLPVAQQKNYYVRTWISEEELVWVYRHCFAAVSRAGANTVAELTLFKIPTVYIPLPFAKHNEQELNVRPLADREASLLLPQAKLTPAQLLTQLQLIKKKHRLFHKRLAQLPPSAAGAERLHSLITKLVTAPAENTHEVFS